MIHNENAYQNAIARNIKANASKTRKEKWLAADPMHQTLYDWVFSHGEFESTFVEGPEDEFYNSEITWTHHPMCKGMNTPFILAMRDAMFEWGGLTEKQTAGLLSAYEGKKKAIAGYAAKNAAEAAGSDFIGADGDRIKFSLEVLSVLSFDGNFGMVYFNKCSQDGNIVMYKGSNDWTNYKGQTLSVTARIKKHETFRGVKQTIITRPTIHKDKGAS